MKALPIVLLLLVVGVIAVGYHQGWFLASSDKKDDKPNVTISVDQNKIKEDKDKAKEKLGDIADKAKEKAGLGNDKVKDTNKSKQ